ncbi:MAG: helix-turn-helix domain-containing protein [Oscillospiraceae bacterium]|nr:helix-turn-helix domain-containing protein [Oscillospiraceae bacterium]
MNKEFSFEARDVQSFYTIKDIMCIFCCGRDKAYEIIHTRGFPKMTIGRKFLISPDALQKWINQNYNSNIIK